MVFRKFFKTLGRVFGFRKHRRRRAAQGRKRSRKRVRPVSRRRNRFSRGKISPRKKKRVVRHRARRQTRKLHRRPVSASRPATRQKTAKKSAKTPWVLAGDITHYFPKVKAAVFKCRVSLAIGDAVWVKGRNTDFRQTVGSMQIDRRPIERASKGQEIGLEVLRDVHEGDRVYLAKA